jgi:DNA-binding transcriptional regulator YiaG
MQGETMTFEQLLVRSRWRQADLARVLGKSTSTVSRWKVRGKAPQYALAYLRAQIELNRYRP